MKKLFTILLLGLFTITGIHSQEIRPHEGLMTTNSISYVPTEKFEKTILKFKSNLATFNKKHTLLQLSFQEQLDKQKTINEERILFELEFEKLYLNLTNHEFISLNEKYTKIKLDYITLFTKQADLKSDFVNLKLDFKSFNETNNILFQKKSQSNLDMAYLESQLISFEENSEEMFKNLKKFTTSFFIATIITTAIVTYCIVDELQPITIYR